MNVYEVAMQYRAALLRGDREAAQRLVLAFADAWHEIKTRLDRLTEAIEASKEAGVEFSPSWLFQQQRYRALLEQVEAEMRRLNNTAAITIVRQQNQALRHAEYYVRVLFEDVRLARSFAGIPQSAFESIVGFLADGSPLRDVLAELGEETSRAVDTALKRAVLMGMPPREVARQVRKEAGGSLVRLLRIARTETLRAYREGIRLSLQQTGFSHWRWVASLSLRTCPACLAMHGRVFPISEPFGTHPNCRCTMVPVDEGLGVPNAEQWLRGLSEEQQVKVLGEQRARLWRGGAIRLEDFVQEREDPRWGVVRTVKPLHSLRLL